MTPHKITTRNIMFSQPMDDYSLNIGLIRGKKRNYLIDTGIGSGSVQPVSELLRGDTKPLVVVNTHWHFDHIMGNWMFGDSLIVAHPLCRALIERHWGEGPVDGVDGETRLCLPNLVMDSEIYFPDDGVRIFFSPGHTADCISVYDEVDRVLYAGDNIGDTERQIVPNVFTDPDTFRALLALYSRIDFDVCISGHNSPQGSDVLERMSAQLDESWTRQLERFGPPEEMSL